MHIYDLSMNVPGGDASAYASALVLIAALLLINMAAIRLAAGWQRRNDNAGELERILQYRCTASLNPHPQKSPKPLMTIFGKADNGYTLGPVQAGKMCSTLSP